MKTIRALIPLFIILTAAPAFAQFPDAGFGDETIPIMVSADMLSYDRENKIYTAEGSVEITRGPMVLRADRVSMNGVTKEAEATGHVYYFNGAEGMIFYADKHFYITGDELEKLGEKTYRVRNGSLTSCDGEIPAWKITGRRSEVTLEGYGKVWGGAFWVKKLPVLYIPFGIFPVKTKRQSGFLFPLFGASDKKGFRFRESFFWAINRSMDATLTADVMTERGVMGGVEYRYFLKKDLRGEMSYTFIDDAGITNTDGTESERGFRWGINAYHRQTLPGGVLALIDANLVSDDTYLEDFADDINVRTSRYLESRASLLKEWYYSALLLDASYFQDLATTADEFTLQRLPRLTYYVRPISLFGTPLAFEMSPSVANYVRDEGVQGMRLNLNPRLSAYISTGYVSITPWIEGDLSWWWLDGDRSYPEEIDRATYTAGVELSTYLAKTYTTDSDRYSSIRHVIKPVVGYWYSPRVTGGPYPDFDDRDMVRAGSVVYVGLVNRILGRRTSSNGGATDELLYAEIGAGIDFEPDAPWLGYDVGEPHVISYFEFRFNPTTYVSMRGKGRYDHDLERFLKLSTDMLFSDKRGDSVSIGYVIESDVIYPKQYEHLVGSMKVIISNSLDLTLGARYSFDEDDFRYFSSRIGYHRQCWGIDFTVFNDRNPGSNEPDELGFFVNLTLTGLGTIPTIDLGTTKY
jgi:LPS-assembly protein